MVLGILRQSPYTGSYFAREGARGSGGITLIGALKCYKDSLELRTFFKFKIEDQMIMANS